jgi:hypothetical protein
MSTLKQRILAVLTQTPGLTDRQLTNLLEGQHAPQQPVNIAARGLERSGVLQRRKRDDGLIGNFPVLAVDGSSKRPGEATAPRPVAALPQRTIREAAEGRESSDPLSEDSLKAALKRWLEEDGWTCRVAWRRERGIDLLAERAGLRWIIEVKGSGSLDAMRVNYFLTILGETLQRMDDRRARYSIALPDLRQYRNLWARLPQLAKDRTGISALFVDQSGRIHMDPSIGRTT